MMHRRHGRKMAVPSVLPRDEHSRWSPLAETCAADFTVLLCICSLSSEQVRKLFCVKCSVKAYSTLCWHLGVVLVTIVWAVQRRRATFTQLVHSSNRPSGFLALASLQTTSMFSGVLDTASVLVSPSNDVTQRTVLSSVYGTL